MPFSQLLIIAMIVVPQLAADLRSIGQSPPRPSQVGTGIVIVPVEAEPDDVELVRETAHRMVPGADVRVRHEVPARFIHDASCVPIPVPGLCPSQVDGRDVVRRIERWYPTGGTGPVMVLAVTSADLADPLADTNFAYAVRSRPHAVMSTLRLGPAGDDIIAIRVEKLLARLIGSVYFDVDDAAILRSGPNYRTHPYGPLERLDDLDAIDPNLCLHADLLDTVSNDWNTPDEFRRQLGCPTVEPVVEPYEYPPRVAAAYDECVEDHGGPGCLDLARLVRTDPAIGRFVDRATRLPNATCVKDCVFAVQRATRGGVVVRSWRREGRLVALHTHWPEQGGAFVDTCYPAAPFVCPGSEPACLDAALLKWVQRSADWRRRGPIPASARRPADC